MRSLDGSITGIHSGDQTLEAEISLRSLHRMLQGGETTYNAGSARIDSCDVCAIWDKEVAPLFLADYKRWGAVIIDVIADYFRDFELEFSLEPDCVTPLDSPSYMEDWASFLHHHSDIPH